MQNLGLWIYLLIFSLIRNRPTAGEQHLNEISKQRRERRYNITTNINFGAFLIESVGATFLIAFFYLSGDNLIFHHIVGMCYLSILFVVNFRYLMNDDELKEIIAFRGWPVALRAMFQSDETRQSIIQNILDQERNNSSRDQDGQIEPSSPRNGAPGNCQRPGEPLDQNTQASNGDECNGGSKDATSQINETPPSGNAEYLSFKRSCRQSIIEKIQISYETNPLQLDLELRNFVELQETCKDNEYHFDDDIFLAAFNQFTLQQKHRSRRHNNGDCAPSGSDSSKSTVAASSTHEALENTNHNVKEILQNVEQFG